MKPKTPFWEENYKTPGKPDTFMQGKPSRALEGIAKSLPPGARVLDVGCGEGRNALHLAGLGFKVTAFDISVAGIGKLLRLAAERQVAIDAFVGDMREHQYPPQTYDLILCMGCLHLILRSEWPQVIHNMKNATVPGGLNIVGVLTEDLPEPPDVRGFFIGLFKEGEIYKYYEDWEVIKKDSFRFTDMHPNGFSHEHAGNNVIAKKPK